MIEPGRGWETLQQRFNRCIGSAHQEIEELVGKKARRALPIAGSLTVTDRVDHAPLVREPAGRTTMQLFYPIGCRSPEFEPKQFAEQMMVAKPNTFTVERHHEGIGILKFEQDLIRTTCLRKKVGQLAVDLIDDRRRKK